MAAVRRVLRTVPGVLDVYSRDRIEADRFDDDPIGMRIGPGTEVGGMHNRPAQRRHVGCRPGQQRIAARRIADHQAAADHQQR